MTGRDPRPEKVRDYRRQSHGKFDPVVVRAPRATCPTCGKDVALRNGGLLREHRERIGLVEIVCPASGEPAS